MRAADFVWLGAVAAFCAGGLAIKLSADSRVAAPDRGSINRDVEVRLKRAGFATQRSAPDAIGWIVARRGTCVVLAGMTDESGQDTALWQRMAGRDGRLAYQYGGAALSEFPRFRGPVLAQAQKVLARAGIALPIAPIIATVERGECAGKLPVLSDAGMPLASSAR